MGLELAIGSLVGALVVGAGAKAAGVSTAIAIGAGVATLAAAGTVGAGILSSQASKKRADQFELQQEAERLQSTTQALDRERRLRSSLARQNALFGGAGVDLGSGTPSVIAGEDLARTEEANRLGNLFSSTRVGILGSQREDTLATGRAQLAGGIIGAGRSLLSFGLQAGQLGQIPQGSAGGAAPVPKIPLQPLVPGA